MRLFVGRERELRTLNEALERAIQGDGSLVLVSGEAGIGKTSLVQQLMREAREHSALVLTGAAYDLSTTPPYGPWLELTDRFPADPHLPDLPEVLKRGTGIGDLQNQIELFEFARDFLVTVSEVRPLIVLLEDLHWSDQTSLDMLRYIARRIDERRILIVATYRDDELTRTHPLFQLLPSLVRESRTLRLELHPLAPEDVRSLVAARWQLGRDDEARLVDHLLSHADGHPLFTVELLNTLEQNGFLVPGGPNSKLEDLSQVPVPTLVQQVIERRLTELGNEARHHMEFASVIGHLVPLEIWQSVAGMPDNELDDVVERAIALNLIKPAVETSGVSFVHALTREALYSGIQPVRRRDWHRRIGEALAESLDSIPDAVAYHFQQAGDKRAVDWLILAGEQAERTFAWREAFERHERGASILQKNRSDDTQLARLFLKLGRLLRFTETRRGIEYHEQARQIALRCDDRALADLALFNAGNQLCMLGDLQQGLQSMHEAVEGIVKNAENVRQTARWSQTMLAADLDAVISSIGTLVSQLAYAGRYRDAIATADRLLPFDWRDALNDKRTANNAIELLSFGDGFWGLGVSLSALGDVHDGKEVFDSCRRLLGNVGYDAHWLFVTSTYLVMHHFLYRTTDLNERHELISGIEKSMRVTSGSAGWPNTTWGYEWYLLQSGRWSELQRMMDERDLPTLAVFQNTSLSARTRLAWYQGRLDDARNLIHHLQPSGPDTGSDYAVHFLQREPHRIGAGMAIDAGALDEARVWLTSHDSWISESGAVLGEADGLLLWAKLHRAEGDVDAAGELATLALKRASNPRHPLALIAVHRFLGELATRTGDLAKAAEHLRESRDLVEACALPYERSLTMLAQAELELSKDNSEFARNLQADVRRIATDLGARPLLRRAEELATKLNPRQGDDRFGLSPREVEVLTLLARGMSDKDIAEELFVSHRTVSHHVSNILRKLDVESRTAAATRATHQGIV